ncbi:hypothetical protein [Streptomyces vilmorinianum]|uniref:hypothetical protein n=1 Tax=Streptomyces vilmorinianum TaxID=3051092 RepID=UPI0010FB5999|nr:hypothetical protein [Streptomyces vilmorinianum]
MNHRTLTVSVGDDFADLADARNVTVEELAQEAIARFLSTEATLVRHEAMRLALRHGSLLRRLGE